ncbi:MAG: hypothetical protein KDK51_10595 [Deltaproteobacteria bacterium]|nr:hypothetical protein [Deltaproteobacteria bacterium]
MKKIWIVWMMMCIGMVGCTKKTSSNGMSEKIKTEVLQGVHDQLLVDTALDLLDIVENYDANNFESKQKEGFLMLEENFRNQAQQHLAQRVSDVQAWGGGQTFFPDEDKIKIEARDHYKGVEARVTVDGELEIKDQDGEIRMRDIQYAVTMVIKNLQDIDVTLWTSK